jgi:hypothetical protein
MSLEALRSLARLHAWTAWLATLALGIAALLHARGRRGSSAMGAIAAALVLATSAIGLAMHDGYRARIRQKLFIASTTLGWLFERKQHLAFGATLLAVSATASSFAALRAVDRVFARELRRAALVGWVASAALALAASSASAIVARTMRF